MKELIAKLEAATEGAWALDKEIAVLEREKIGDCADDEVPPFTTSLDAALTLVTRGTQWHVNTSEYAEYRAEVDYGMSIWAKTAPLAFCIAALKARRQP